ncbi:Dehydrogenase [Pseudomonas fluorescens R124]|uniref:Dehydrogenase n=2 Tax=Pseudomonas fluorescens TaxID=294 RepID=A0A7U9GSN4_PSEFL|nr:Dehydrogenase [Pseudomonas fluorescens R124]
MKLEDIDGVEINEAFASVAMAWLKETGYPYEQTNVNGGAIALGHPLGATGTRLMCSLLHELERSGGRFGLQTMCEGGGQAIETFGGLDVMVNNAGICRDRMFTSLSESDWDAVMAVHLKGHFCISSHAARYWREQVKGGQPVSARIINTNSGAGLQGSIGQSNYAAAKAGIATLTLVQAAELGRYGITVNALAPAARTGMTEGVFADVMKKPEEGFDYFAPENVAPLVVWLGSQEPALVNGQTFEVEGGKLSIADGWRRGPELDRQGRWAASEVGDAVAQLMDRVVPPAKFYGN